MATGPTPADLALLRPLASAREAASHRTLGSAPCAAAPAMRLIDFWSTAPLAPPWAMSEQTSLTIPSAARPKRAGRSAPVLRSDLLEIGAQKQSTSSSTSPTAYARQIVPLPMQTGHR